VECLDTGLDTSTGGRALAAARHLGDVPFCLTYADGVADIDLHALLAAHRAHGDLATVTVVRPELPFGVAEIAADGRVAGFREKPRAQQWVNGGFFVFEPGVRDHLAEDSILEREPLERLAAAGQLHAFRHDGFWDCMDTYKDAVLLNDLWAQGLAPWKARTPA
jgi:glucose-1-phosphate cytidylyltransferase